MLKPFQPRFWIVLVTLSLFGLLSMALLPLLPLPLIKNTIGEFRLIPSETMMPTLIPDDRVFVQRIHHPATEIQRGDILVFYPPMTILRQDLLSVYLRESGLRGLVRDKNTMVDVAYIKRVIGLPGERVKVVPGGGIDINGHRLNEPYVNEIAISCTIMQPGSPEFIRAQIAQHLHPTCDEVTVPLGHYFMMGDNRNLSADSRYWGFASADRVIGRAVMIVTPSERAGTIARPSY